MKQEKQGKIEFEKIQSEAMNDFLKHQNHMLNVMNEALKTGNVGAAATISKMEQQNYNIFMRYSQYQTDLSSMCTNDGGASQNS